MLTGLITFFLFPGVASFANPETQITILPGTVVFVDSTTVISYAGDVIVSGEELIIRGSTKTRNEKPALIAKAATQEQVVDQAHKKTSKNSTTISCLVCAFRSPLSSRPSPDSPGYQYFSASTATTAGKEKTSKEFLLTSIEYPPLLSSSSTIFPSRITHHASRITRHAQNKSPPTTNGEMVKW